MDHTLKKRLIGAAILVVIAAIVLPMFLSDRPPGRADTQTLPLEIPPGPDRDLSQVTLPIDGQAPAPSVADPVVAVDTAAQPPVSDPDAASAVPPNQTASAAPAAEGVVAASPTEPSAVHPTVTTPAPTPAPASAQQQTPPPANASAPPVPAADGSFWVSLGSYAQVANADRVASAASQRGIQTSRETVNTDGRALIRLRAGPYANRAQAEQARQLLIAAVPDARPKVETSAQMPSADAPETAVATATAGAWAVQVGAFGQEANARQLSERLRSAGFPSFVLRRGDSYTVRVGPYVRRADADAQRQRLKNDQRLDGMIVSHTR
jgi:DedD protein